MSGTAGHSLPVLAAHLLEVIFGTVNLGEWREKPMGKGGGEKKKDEAQNRMLILEQQSHRTPRGCSLRAESDGGAMGWRGHGHGAGERQWNHTGIRENWLLT